MTHVEPSSGDDLTVFVVAADPVVGDQLTVALGYRGFGFQQFSCCRDFLAARRPAWRGCVLASLRLPDGSGLDLLPGARKTPTAEPALPVVLMADELDVATVRRAFLGGAIDVLPAPVDMAELLAAVGRALQLARRRWADELAGGARNVRLEVLTPREAEIAQLVRLGHGNRRIGEDLGISHRTVEVHKTRLMRKLGVHSLAELISLPLAVRPRARTGRKTSPLPGK